MDDNYELHKRTLKKKRKNLITFYGNNKNPIPLEFFNEIQGIYNKREDKINEKLNSDEDHNNYWGFVFNEDHYSYYDYNWEFPDNYDLFTYNASIGISKYFDYQSKKELFYLVMDTGEIDSEYFYHQNQFRCKIDNELIEFYNRWKQFRLDNPNKYNEPYKENQQYKLEQYISSHNQLVCETCLFTDHCNGLYCLANLPTQKVEIPKTEQYKINLHILEPCNYRCKHCFAHFDNHNMLPVNLWKHIVDNCAEAIYVSEFNIAGGEPLLYRDLNQLIKYVYNKRHKVSIITNGILMTEDWIKNNAPYLETIGFSIDSFNNDTLIEMGRKTADNKVLTKEKFLELCSWIKKYSPYTKIKTNTVVTSLNYKEDLVSIFKDVNIDRWKILKMKIFKNESFDNSNIAITDKQYGEFLDTNNKVENIVIEDSLKNSYIMIDANGTLVDNTNDKYETIINVVDDDFIDGFKRMTFDKDLYFSRYN